MSEVRITMYLMYYCTKQNELLYIRTANKNARFCKELILYVYGLRLC